MVHGCEPVFAPQQLSGDGMHCQRKPPLHHTAPSRDASHGTSGITSCQAVQIFTPSGGAGGEPAAGRHGPSTTELKQASEVQVNAWPLRHTDVPLYFSLQTNFGGSNPPASTPGQNEVEHALSNTNPPRRIVRMVPLRRVSPSRRDISEMRYSATMVQRWSPSFLPQHSSGDGKHCHRALPLHHTAPARDSSHGTSGITSRTAVHRTTPSAGFGHPDGSPGGGMHGPSTIEFQHSERVHSKNVPARQMYEPSNCAVHATFGGSKPTAEVPGHSGAEQETRHNATRDQSVFTTTTPPTPRSSTRGDVW